MQTRDKIAIGLKLKELRERRELTTSEHDRHALSSRINELCQRNLPAIIEALLERREKTEAPE